MLALTAGDPGGVGIEIALAAWQRRDDAVPAFALYGDPRIIAGRARMVGVDAPIEEVDPDTDAAVFRRALPVVPLAARWSNRPGEADAANAEGVIEAIDRAAADTMNGRASALVTGPIAKKSLYDAGFRHPGHTEYLAHLAERATGAAVMPVMMLAGPELRTVPITIHVPLREVPRLLTRELILATARIVDEGLRARFGVRSPRLAMAGLNPHAGEGGSIGDEEQRLIVPAVEALKAEGLDVAGPLPADTMFHARARAGYDAALCMYHDQALIPAKALAFDEAVNVTLGLPFVRTSPDHGTAFGIAGKGVARPGSLIAALRLAARMTGGEPAQAPA